MHQHYKQFCKDQNTDYVKLLLHSSPLSKGNCLKSFMEFFDNFGESVTLLLLTVDGKALTSYLANMFEKLDVLNKELQETNMTPVN